MSGQRQMYLGSKDGVLVLAEHDGQWQEERRLLPGKNVKSLEAPEGTPLMYAKAADGVYASSDSGQSWDRVFEGNVYHLEWRVPYVEVSGVRKLGRHAEKVNLFR